MSFMHYLILILPCRVDINIHFIFNPHHGVTLVTFSILAKLDIRRTGQFLVAGLGGPFSIQFGMMGCRMMGFGPQVRSSLVRWFPVGREFAETRQVAFQERFKIRETNADDSNVDFDDAERRHGKQVDDT